MRLPLVLLALFGIVGSAHGQNGLYTPITAPTPPTQPLMTHGMLIDRDSIFYLDSIQVRQVAPSPTYDSIWVSMEACSGIRLADSVRAAWTISAAPGDGFIPPGGRYPVPGYTFVEHRNIVVLEKYVLNRDLLGHEMVHALIWEDRHVVGHNEHGDMPEFARCGVQNQ